MAQVLYCIGFTLSFCLSLFFGMNDTSTYTQQACLVFAGFCLGGIAIMILEEL